MIECQCCNNAVHVEGDDLVIVRPINNEEQRAFLLADIRLNQSMETRITLNRADRITLIEMLMRGI